MSLGYFYNIPFCFSLKIIWYNIYFISIYPSGIVTKLLKSTVKLFTLKAHWQLTNICCTNWTAQKFHVVYLNFPRAPATEIRVWCQISSDNQIHLYWFVKFRLTVLVHSVSLKSILIWWIISMTLFVWRKSMKSHKKFSKTEKKVLNCKDEDLKLFEISDKKEVMSVWCSKT